MRLTLDCIGVHVRDIAAGSNQLAAVTACYIDRAWQATAQQAHVYAYASYALYIRMYSCI